jgi:hypothetical protein
VKIAKTFTMPEEDPVVPERLAERITNLLPHAVKIDVKESTQGGWRVFNTIYIEGGEEASEVYTIIKAAADHRAAALGQSGKYRAQVWRLLPGKLDHERHIVTFHVHDMYDDEAPAVEEEQRRDQNAGWRELVDGYHRFTEFIAEYNHRATDRVLEQSKQDAERLNPLSDVIHDFVGMYRDGLRMKAESVREVSDLRLRQQLAEAQAKDSGKFWEMFAPAVQVAAAQAGQRFLGGPAKPRALPPGTAPAPAARRRELETLAVTPPTPPSTPPSSPPPPPPRSAPPPSHVAAPVPATLHELAAALLDNLGAECLVRLGRMLDDEQVGYLEAIARARDDDSSAEAIAGLMQSLMANPAAVVAVQQLLMPDQLGALKQIAVLARRHLDERNAEGKEGALPSSGDAPSSGEAGSGA